MASGQKKTQRPPPETILRLWDLEQPVADLIGKGKHVRSVPVPAWVKNAIVDWATRLRHREWSFFRRVWVEGIRPRAVRHW